MNERRRRNRAHNFESEISKKMKQIKKIIQTDKQKIYLLVKDIRIKPGEEKKKTRRFSFHLIDGGGVNNEKYWWSVSLIALQICGEGDVVHSTRHGYNAINWYHILTSTRI